MSIKKLFQNKKQQTGAEKGPVKASLSQITSSIESADLVEAHQSSSLIFEPNVNFDKPENFVKFGSAKKYYSNAIKRIYKQFPYDDTNAAKVQFINNLTALERHVYEKDYPRTNGFVLFNPPAQDTYTGTAAASYKNSTTHEYITFDGWSVNNLYDLSNKRENALSVDFVSGSTIEWWMKKPGGTTYGGSDRQVIYDLRDAENLAQLIIHLQQAGTNDQITYKINLGNGGGSWQSRVDLDLNTGIDWSADESWHHYAIAQSTSSVGGFRVKLYVDGALADDKNSKAGVDFAGNVPFPSYITGSLQGTVGALGGADGTDAAQGWGKVSASLDEFRVWKVERNAEQIGRNYVTPVHGGVMSSSVNRDLGIYYKFNEGIVGDDTDTTILDYSGRVCNGAWTGYTTTPTGDEAMRQTGSAMVLSDKAIREEKDPIVYGTHSEIQSLLTTKETSGSQYDLENLSSLHNSMPRWILEEDENGGQLGQILQIMGSYLDTLHGQIGEMVNIKEPTYPVSGSKPYPFSNKLLNSLGFEAPEAFVDEDILRSIGSRDDKRVFEEKVYNLKQLIYRNIYNNLSYINKSKGTEKSFRNLFRCFGVDDELVNLNVYSDNEVFTLDDDFGITYTKRKAIDFSGISGSNRSATIYQFPTTVGGYDHGYISSSANSYIPLTAEAEIIFPRFSHLSQSIETLTTSSLFGVHTSNAKHAETTYYAGGSGKANPGDFDVAAYAVRSLNDIESVYFRLTSSKMGFDLTSSVFPTSASSGGSRVYDDSKWNFAFRVRPEHYPFSNNVTASQRRDVEFYGVSSIGGQVVHEFSLSKSIDINKADGSGRGIGHWLTGSYKRFYIGAERTNFTGSVVNKSDVKFLNFRVWADYLTDDEIKYHARDPSNAGRLAPYQNAFVHETASVTYPPGGGPGREYVPRMDTLALHWDFSSITGSEGTRIVEVLDRTSGSLDLKTRYVADSYGEIVKANHPGSGTFFDAGADPYSLEFVPTSRQRLPEQVQSSDMIKVLTRDQNVLRKDTKPTKTFFAVEMSMYEIISKNILNFFAGVDDFNNLIGDPVNAYRANYKAMEKLRNLFFEKVNNQPDVEKFVNMYKWLDSVLDTVIINLFPASARSADKARTIIESHVLERNKYRHRIREIKPLATIGNIPFVEPSKLAVPPATRVNRRMAKKPMPTLTLDDLATPHAELKNTKDSFEQDDKVPIPRQQGASMGSTLGMPLGIKDRYGFRQGPDRGVTRGGGANQATFQDSTPSRQIVTAGVFEQDDELAPDWHDSIEEPFNSKRRIANTASLDDAIKCATDAPTDISIAVPQSISDYPPQEGGVKIKVLATAMGDGQTGPGPNEIHVKLQDSEAETAQMLAHAINGELGPAGILPYDADLRQDPDIEYGANCLAESDVSEFDNETGQFKRTAVGVAGVSASLGGSSNEYRITSNAGIGGGDVILTGSVNLRASSSALGGEGDVSDDFDTWNSQLWANTLSTIFSANFFANWAMPSINLGLGAKDTDNTKEGRRMPVLNKKYDAHKTSFVEGKSTVDGLFIAFLTGSTNKKSGLRPTRPLPGAEPASKSPRLKPVIVYDRENVHDRGSHKRLPFTVMSSAVEQGYASQLNKGTAASQWTRVSLEDKHKDTYGDFIDAPMQSYWTRENVGGNLYRQNNLFVTNSQIARGKSRVEGYHVKIDPSKNSAILTGPRNFEGEYDPIFAHGARLKDIKRPVNIQNLSSSGYSLNETTVAGSGPVRANFGAALNSNYHKDYEVVSINDRKVNNKYFRQQGGVTASQTAFGAFGQFWWVAAKTASYTPAKGASMHQSTQNRVVDFIKQDRENTGSNKTIFVSKFSAPGSAADMGAGFTDIESGQFSPYNALPYRNIVYRRALNKLWSRPAAAFGTDSLFGDEFANFHKTQRNDGIKITDASTDPLARKIDRDNYWVSRAIPKNDLGYSWIKKSWIGHMNSDLTVSSTLGNVSHITSSDFAVLLGFTSSADTITFVSGGGIGAAFDGAPAAANRTIGFQTGRTTYASSMVEFTPTDFVGMNTLIHEPISASQVLTGPLATPARQLIYTSSNNVLGYPGVPAPGETLGNRLNNYLNADALESFTHGDSFSPNEDQGTEPYIFNMLMLNRNGPYGHPTWKQIRTGEHKLARWLRKNNIYQNTRVVYNSDAQRWEPKVSEVIQSPLTSKFKPVSQGYKDFSVKYSFANDFHFFAKTYNSGSNKSVVNEREWKVDPSYEKSALYEESDTNWRILRYAETVFPKDENVFRNKSRKKTKYDFFWDDVLENRVDQNAGKFEATLGMKNSQGVHVGKNESGADQDDSFMSVWPMDVHTSSGVTKEKSGELMRMDNVAMADISAHFAMPDSASAKFGRFYSACRPHYLAADQAGKGPFFDNYRDYSWDAILAGQDYSQLAEFTITKYQNAVITDYYSDYYQDFYTFDLTGSEVVSSSIKDFLETYSHSEELIHLERVGDLYGEPTEMSITFKAIKKLIPQDGFYPIQRTVQLAQEFSGSYGAENLANGANWSQPKTSTGNELGTWLGSFTSSAPGKTGTWKTVLEPFYAPGIMFNTIKAGIAVDYPIVDQRVMDSDEFTRTTGSAGAPKTTHGPNPSMHCSASYSSRLPFEAIIEPYLWSQKIIGSASVDISPHNAPNAGELDTTSMRLYDMDPELVVDSTGTIQPTNGVYEAHAHNFFAEVPNFFLGGLSVLRSKSESEWVFPGPLSSSADGVKKWEMEIYIQKPGNWFMHEAPGYFGHWPYVHHLPSYYGTNPAETCDQTGPSLKPCVNSAIPTGYASRSNKASLKITFDPAPIFEKYPERLARGTFTLDDIINNSLVEYSNQAWNKYGGEESAGMGMSLTASVDVFNVLHGGQEGQNKWAINTKFETPMFNFADSSTVTASNPDMQYGGTYRGIWHQYAYLPTPNAYQLLRFGVANATPLPGYNTFRTGSLADACGFSLAPIELGELAQSKLIYEAVVAIPFYTNQDTKEEKFFDIPISTFEESYGRAAKGEIKTSIDDLVYKQAIGRYVFPPKYDFTKIRNKSKKPFVQPKDFSPARPPFAMYIFEFSHELTQKDLGDIWQNVMPSISQYATKQDLNIKHPIVKGEIFGPEMLKYNKLEKIPKNIRWKIFKIKQKANNNYYQTVDNYVKGKPVGTDQNDFGANWPYDFFSLVELGKMDVELGFEKTKQKARGLESGKAIKRTPPNKTELKAAVMKAIVHEERKLSAGGICRDRFALNYSEKGKCSYPPTEDAIQEFGDTMDSLCDDPDAENFSHELPCVYSEAKILKFNRPQLVNCPNDGIQVEVGSADARTFSVADADPGQGETLQVNYELSPISGWDFINTNQLFNGADAQDITITVGPTSDAHVGNYYLSVDGTDEDGNKSEKCVLTIVVDGEDGAPGLLPDVGVTGTPPADIPVQGRAALLPATLRPRTPTTPALAPAAGPAGPVNRVRIVGGTLDLAGGAGTVGAPGAPLTPAAAAALGTAVSAVPPAVGTLAPEDFIPEFATGAPLPEEGVPVTLPTKEHSRRQGFDKRTMEMIHEMQRAGETRMPEELAPHTATPITAPAPTTVINEAPSGPEDVDTSPDDGGGFGGGTGGSGMGGGGGY